MKHKKARGFSSQPSSSFQDSADLNLLQQWITTGMQLFQVGQLAQAEDACQQALKLDSAQPEALYLMGLIQYQKGYKDEAIQHLRQALVVRPNWGDALSALGVMLDHRGEPQEAIAILKTAAQQHPDNALAHFNLGRALQRNGDLEAATASYQQSAQLQPSMEVFNNLGLVQFAQYQFAEALTSYEKAIQIQPNPFTLINMGDTCWAMGDLEAAAGHYRQATQLDPGNVMAYKHLGKVLQKQDKFQDAIQAYQRAIDLNPRDAEAHLNLGNALIWDQQCEAAEATLLRCLDLNSTSVDAWLNLADLYLVKGEAKAALEASSRGLAIDPLNTHGLSLKTIAVSEHPGDPSLHVLLGYDQILNIIHCDQVVAGVDLEAMNAALIQVLKSHPTLAWEKSGNATRQGYHTGNLVREEVAVLTQLKTLIQKQVSQFLQQLACDSQHPYAAYGDQQLQISDLWGVVMQKGGHQIPHIHPSGVVSGVYYLKVVDQYPQGCIEFGCYPERFDLKHDHARHCVQPQVGMLILFPSYLYHRTIPFAADQERICIAFDLGV